MGNNSNNNQREGWSTRIGFVLAAAGSAVGLGNIWRFPYVAGVNGGAAFLLIYLVTIGLIGYPLFLNEMLLGRKTQKNPVGAFRALAPGAPWWLVGALGVLTGFVILSYYSVVAGWALHYTWRALFEGFSPAADYSAEFGSLISSPGTLLLCHLVFMILCVAVISAGVVKGIEKCVFYLMPLLLVLMVAVIVRAVTIPGAGRGIAFFLRPDWSRVTAGTFLDAIAQSFFTLSLGMGAILTYGSYLRRRESAARDALEVVAMDTGIAILAGFAIFPAVFALGFEAAQGPGLTFVTLPAVFARMAMGRAAGFVFFLVLSIAALTSGISLLEVVVAWAMDEKGLKRFRAALSSGFVIFLAGIPAILGYSGWSGVRILGMDILDSYDWLVNSVFLPLGGLLAALFTGYVWTASKAAVDCELGDPASAWIRIWGFLIRYLIPAAIILIMVSGLANKFFG